MFLSSKWKYKVYILAQVLGGIVGAGLVYSQYIHAIDIFEGGRQIRTLSTAGFFSSFAVRMVSDQIHLFVDTYTRSFEIVMIA